MEVPDIIQGTFFTWNSKNPLLGLWPGVGCECVISLYPNLPYSLHPELPSSLQTFAPTVPNSLISSGTFPTHKGESIHSQVSSMQLG